MKMMWVTLLALAIEFDFASSADNFTECADPNNLPFGQSCVPFITTTNITDPTTQLNLESPLFTLPKCKNVFPQTDEKLVEKLWFNIYKKGELVDVVNGLKFWQNASKYVDPKSKTKILMSGFQADYNIDPITVAKTYDWRTHCAKKLYENADPIFNPEGRMMAINWGAYSSKNYSCLVQSFIRPLGKMLGAMFRDQLEPGNLHLIGHSLGAHVLGIACDEVKKGNKMIDQLDGLDIAGLMFIGDKFGVVDGGMRPDSALHTCALYTDFGHMGTQNFDKALVNIKVNPGLFEQPGSNGSPMYSHIFAVMMFGSMCAQMELFDKRHPDQNLNFLYNRNITAGSYEVFTDNCYPNFCPESINS